MALLITDECISCGACLPECPNEAIFETRGDAASFGRKVSREATAGKRGDREANPLDADRVADGDVRQIEAAAVDFQGLQAHDPAHRLHDPREHGAEGSAKARSNP